MSTSLSMSLDQSIAKRKEEGGGRFSKRSPKKFGGKRLFKKRFDRGDRDKPFFKKDRPFKRDRERNGSGRRFGSDRPKFQNRFIRRTGPRPAGSDNEDSGPRREREPRESEGHGERCKIKISNLDFNITHKDIMELFSKIGTVKKNKIIYDELGRSRGKAFVEFEKQENAANAIKEYNGAVLDGKTITVEYDHDRPRRSSGLLRKPISRDNFRRDDFRRDRERGDRGDRGDFKRERGSDRDWRGGRRGEDRDFDRKPFRRGFRGSFRKNRY